MTDIKNEDTGDKKSLNFIEQAVEKDLKEGKNGGKVHHAMENTQYQPHHDERGVSFELNLDELTQLVRR